MSDQRSETLRVSDVRAYGDPRSEFWARFNGRYDADQVIAKAAKTKSKIKNLDHFPPVDQKNTYYNTEWRRRMRIAAEKVRVEQLKRGFVLERNEGLPAYERPPEELMDSVTGERG